MPEGLTMKIISRRTLAASFIAAASYLLATPTFAAPAVPTVHLDIQADQPGPVIARQIYGQFAEHLGSGIYEGLWVGTDSPIPNVRGWRSDVVGALKALKVPVLRWPGGCFADEYHWRDGIGPRAQRPVRVNNNWGGVPERNGVGTHEFFDLAEQVGAETYVNGNLGTGSAQEMAEWLEYMTADGVSSLAQQRRANGRDQPFRVNYFGIGNEAWGCGGHMSPEYYVNLYKQVATFLKAPRGNRPLLVASGGERTDTRWMDVLSRDINARMDAITHHQYSLPTGNWQGSKGKAIGFPESQWLSTLAVTQVIDNTLLAHRAILDRNDPKKKLGIYFDEWGSWYDPEPGTDPGFLVQRNTLRDAVLAALHFNVFHKHAERVRMTNVAQMVNVLQAMVVTQGPQMALTPTYHAFEMYMPFQDATALAFTLKDNPNYALDKLSMPAISATAARGLDGKVYVGLVNVNPRDALELELAVGGRAAHSVKGRVLTAAAMDAENAISAAPQVLPQAFEAQARDGKLRIRVPAKAVLVLAVQP
jgi:alpha-N-arabinofuranosidase